MTQLVPNAMLGADANNLGRLLNIVSFTASGTYTKNAASNFVLVHVLGGGGGAGSTSGNASQMGGAQSGNGGGCAIRRIATAALGASETVTIGAGGAGASSAGVAQGSTGGTSSFGAWCSATGGTGGVGRLGQGTTGTIGKGGVGSGGDINLQGGNVPAIAGYSTASQNTNGAPGAGPYGGPGAICTPYGNNAPAVNADANTGGGGASGLGTYNATTPVAAGGNGGSGLVIIFEYA